VNDASVATQPQYHDNGGERQGTSGSGRVCACAALLPAARAAGTERPDIDSSGRRRRPLGNYRTSHLEATS